MVFMPLHYLAMKFLIVCYYFIKKILMKVITCLSYEELSSLSAYLWLLRTIFNTDNFDIENNHCASFLY